MEKETTDRYRQILELRLQALEAEARSNADARDIVTLDQQSVGRLSRMDALQQQAMAKATQTRRDVETRQIRAALRRLEDSEFGYCERCGEDIPDARLLLTLTAATCVACARS